MHLCLKVLAQFVACQPLAAAATGKHKTTPSPTLSPPPPAAAAAVASAIAAVGGGGGGGGGGVSGVPLAALVQMYRRRDLSVAEALAHATPIVQVCVPTPHRLTSPHLIPRQQSQWCRPSSSHTT